MLLYVACGGDRMTAKEYAEKHNVKYIEKSDGSVVVQHEMTKRPETDYEEFMKRLARPIRVILKMLGGIYEPNPYNFKFYDWPTAKLRVHIKKFKDDDDDN